MRSNYIFVFILCLGVSCKSSSQPKGSTIRSNDPGQIFYSKVDLVKTKPPELIYVNNFNLHTDEFLSIHFTLEQPLVQSLKELAPTLSEDELLNKGNFQFSFLIDGKVIYVENLNTGAGTKPLKTAQLDQVVRLVTPAQIDFWGWFMWQRFMRFHNGQVEFTEGKHTLSIVIKSYVIDETVKVGGVLAKGDIRVDVPTISIDESLVSVQKIQANSDWAISKDSFDRKKIEGLNRAIAKARFKDISINGIVVIKNNQLLIEQYFNGEKRNSLHDVRSVGKSFASSIMGIAITDGYIESEDLLLKDFYNLKSFENWFSDNICGLWIER